MQRSTSMMEVILLEMGSWVPPMVAEEEEEEERHVDNGLCGKAGIGESTGLLLRPLRPFSSVTSE